MYVIIWSIISLQGRESRSSFYFFGIVNMIAQSRMSLLKYCH